MLHNVLVPESVQHFRRNGPSSAEAVCVHNVLQPACPFAHQVISCRWLLLQGLCVQFSLVGERQHHVHNCAAIFAAIAPSELTSLR